MLIVVPADPGYGDGLGQVGGTAAITETGFHDANGAIVLELGFNRPTWLNDAAECNPRVLPSRRRPPSRPRVAQRGQDIPHRIR